MGYRCLIVEDELPAQRILQKFIADVPSLELVESSSNALDALEILESGQIDILFLDIHLPKVKGVEFLKSLNDPPKVIFTTAYAEYAVQGFELDASDYLLKPFSFERFLKAVNKTIAQIKMTSESLESPDKFKVADDIVFFKSDKKIFRINLNELLYIEGLKDYVRIVTLNDSHMLLQTMKHWAEILPGDQFQRIHKSYIVNLKQIRSITGNTILIDQKELPIGRSFKEGLISEIQSKFLN